jgi:protein gp37
MTENSKIVWTDHTFNAWIGCTKVSPACDHCYAESGFGKRFGIEWGHDKPRRLTAESNWRKPLTWDRQAAASGTRARVFANSLSDVFDAEVDNAWRDRLMALIAVTPNLDWMLLTKRPKVARDYLTADPVGLQDWINARAREMFHRPDVPEVGSLPLPNLWLGTTAENQKMADHRIPLLLDTPAARHFVSCEPLLGPVDLDVAWHGESALSAECWGDCGWCAAGYPPLHNCRKKLSSFQDRSGLDLVIAGGESGPGARPSHPDWFRSLRDQCAASGTEFMFKQWGDWLPWEPIAEPFWESQNEQEQDSHTLFPADFDTDPKWDDGLGFVSEGLPHAAFQRVGKKAAGRLLDGVEHNGRIGA